MYKQWLRVSTHSKMIKHNKDLFECIDDPFALLDKPHIFIDAVPTAVAYWTTACCMAHRAAAARVDVPILP
jgi:hypothetical protein